MRAERQAHGDVVFDHMFALGHAGQGDGGLGDTLAIEVASKKRQRVVAGDRAGGPERLTAIKPQAGKDIRLGQRAQKVGRGAGAGARPLRRPGSHCHGRR